MPVRGFTEYAIATVADSPIASGGSRATSSLKLAVSVENFWGRPPRSTFVTSRSAASRESVASGARRAWNVIVAVPAIVSFSMSNASSALYDSMW